MVSHRTRSTLLPAKTHLAAFSLLGLAVAALLPLLPSCAWAAPVTALLEDAEGKLKGWPGSVAVDPDASQGKASLRWTPDAHANAQSLNFDFAGRGVELSEWDRLVFDYKMPKEGCVWWGVKVVDFPLGDGMQATWQLTDPEVTKPGVWHKAVIDLQHPTWLWGEKPDKTSQLIMFRCQMAAGKVTPILLDNLRVERDPFRIQKVERQDPVQEGDVLYSNYEVQLQNATDDQITVALGLRHTDPKLAAEAGLQEVVIPARSVRSVKAQLIAQLKGDKAASPLTTLSTELFAQVKGMADTEKTAALTLAVPLGKLQHPFALLTKQDVPRILEAVQKSPEAKAVYDGLKQRADSWLTKTPQYPDRGGQWWHWYTCKACGGKLVTKSPTEHVCADCGKMYTGWPYDDVVLDREHSALAGAIRDCGVMFTLTGNKAYAAKAREILMGYAERYLNYPLHDINGKPNKGGGRVGPQTLDESTWLIPVVQGFDCIYDTLSAEDVKYLADKMLLPAAWLIHDHQWGIHNICCWHDSAYGLVGLALAEPTLAADAISGPKGFHQQVEKGISDDGLWYEGAWGYHYYTMMALNPIAVAAHNIGIDVYSERYKRMYDAPLKFMAPKGELPAFHDSGTSNALGSGNLYEIAYARWQDPIHLLPVIQAGRKSLETLLYGAPLGATPEFKLQSTVFPAAGWAILRSGDVGTSLADKHIPQNYLALDFGPHGGGHGHPDKLSFVFYGKGTLLAEDPGCIAYGNPAHQGWFRQSVSHNTVVVNGKSQQACTGETQFASFGDGIGIFSARADGAYPGVRLRRTVALIGDRLIDVFLCQATEGEATFDWCYHNRGAFESVLPLQPMTAGPTGDGYSWAKEWRQAGANQEWTAVWRGDKAPSVAFAQAASDGSREVLSAIGMGNPTKIKVPFVVSRQKGKSALFCSAMQVFDGPDTPQLQVRVLPISSFSGSAEEQPVAVEVTGNGVRDVLLVNPGGGALKTGEFELEGQGAALRYRGEALESLVVAGEARVRINGRLTAPTAGK